jgi:hypothetical protein
MERLAAAPALHADPQQPAGALVHGNELAEHFQRLQEHLGIVRHHVAPARAIAAGGQRRGDDAKVLRLPVRANQHALVEIFDLILVIGRARHDYAEVQRRIVGARVTPFGNRGAFSADVQVPLRLAAGDDEIEAFIGLLVHEPVGADRRAEHVRAHAPAQQRHRIFLDVQQRAVVVGPGNVGLGVLDHIAKQLAAGDVLEADPELRRPTTSSVYASSRLSGLAS